MERYVGVVGPGEPAAVELDLATEVGELLAVRGAVVVTGGLGGVMAAAVRGSQRGGGRSVSLLPGTDRSAAGAPATIVVPTGLGQLRNGLLVNAVDGIVAVGGSWGTLSEVALARRAGRPVVWLNGWVISDGAGHPVDLGAAGTAPAAVDALFAYLDAG
jgi:uncharacterized protein (TIGR00725 family)